LLTRTLWAIAAGGPEQPRRIEDYESVTTLLTDWLYIAAQMPHGTHAQQPTVIRYARPGTAVLIDTDKPQPQLLELLADLNPLNGGPGLPQLS
jgi:hypothetical protein